jgi:hypothetical protein
MEHRSTRRRLATLGLTASIVAGGALAGATLGAPTISGAQDTETTVATEDTQTTATTDDTAPDDARPDPGDHLADVLQPLVDDGTLNQEQVDAVIATLVEAGPPEGPHGGRGGHHGPMHLDAAATALGMTTDELAAALREGSSIADVAADEGVDVQAVIDAMVAEVRTHLDEEVASGEHTQEEADAIIADATENITAMVNGEQPAGRPGMRGPGGPGGPHGHFGDDDTTDTTAS